MKSAIRPPAKDETPLSPSEVEILQRILMNKERTADMALSYPAQFGEFA